MGLEPTLLNQRYVLIMLLWQICAHWPVGKLDGRLSGSKLSKLDHLPEFEFEKTLGTKLSQRSLLLFDGSRSASEGSWTIGYPLPEHCFFNIAATHTNVSTYKNHINMISCNAVQKKNCAIDYLERPCLNPFSKSAVSTYWHSTIISECVKTLYVLSM